MPRCIIVDNWITERSNVTQEFTKPHTPVSEDKNRENLSSGKSTRTSEIYSLNVAPTKNVENDNTVLLSQSCTVNEKLFKGKIFLIFLSVK